MLCRIAPKIEEEVGAIETRIERVALSPYGETIAKYGEIMQLMDEKIRLINLKVLHRILRDVLLSDERKLLKQIARGETYAKVGKTLGLATSSVFKRVSKIIDRISKVLDKAGWSEERLNREFSSLSLIKRARA